MIIAVIRQLFVDSLGEWLKRVPDWVLWSAMGLALLVAWIVPDFILGLEETFVAIVIVQSSLELVRRKDERKKLEAKAAQITLKPSDGASDKDGK